MKAVALFVVLLLSFPSVHVYAGPGVNAARLAKVLPGIMVLRATNKGTPRVVLVMPNYHEGKPKRVTWRYEPTADEVFAELRR